jgi:lambda repressor-like predicted transcriptional regulator
MQSRDDQTGSEPFDLITARLDAGLSLRAAAREIGVPIWVIRYAESGGRPQPQSAKRIADFWGLRVTQIWPVEDKTAVA